MAGVKSLPGEVYVGVPSLRRVVANAVTSDSIGGLAEIWRALPRSDLRAAVSHPGDDAAAMVERVRAAITSTKPVQYLGDDYALGVLSEALQVSFIILRTDGTIQNGMPDITPSRRIMILLFDDPEQGSCISTSVPTFGSASPPWAGHYDLVTFKDSAMFTPSTFPSSMLERFKSLGVRFPAAPLENGRNVPKIAPAPLEAPAAVIERDDNDRAESSSPIPGARAGTAAAKPEFGVFPVALHREPSNSEQWVGALLATIESMDARRDALARDFAIVPPLEQRYQIASTVDDMDLVITLTGTPGVSHVKLQARVNDHFDGLVVDDRHEFASTRELVHWLLESGLVSRRVIVRIAISVNGSHQIPISSMDAIIFGL